MKDRPYISVTVELNQETQPKASILDVEYIQAQSLKEATRLIKNIQLAELQGQGEAIFETSPLRQYTLNYHYNLGLVESLNKSMIFVLPYENMWWDYLEIYNKVEWHSLIYLEWTDYILEVLTPITETFVD